MAHMNILYHMVWYIYMYICATVCIEMALHDHQILCFTISIVFHNIVYIILFPLFKSFVPEQNTGVHSFDLQCTDCV